MDFFCINLSGNFLKSPTCLLFCGEKQFFDIQVHQQFIPPIQYYKIPNKYLVKKGRPYDQRKRPIL